MLHIHETFQKPQRPERVIQFGEGRFLRGFVDWLLKKLNDSGLFCGSAVIVQPMPTGFCEKLEKQNGLYTHIIRGVEGVETSVIDVVSRCVNPYEDFQAFLKLADNPEFRFIVSNTTEAGISYVDEPFPTDKAPVSFPAKVTALLYRRFKNGMDGFILLPCELIDRNADNLKKLVLRYAEQWGLEPEFAAWVCEKNHFCCTLVDRIVTGPSKDDKTDYIDEMLNASEYFHLWVIEGDKALADEIPFHKAGLNVLWTDDLEVYRTRKVRILNGAHTSTVAYALLNGIDTVKDCMENETMLQHLRKCVFEEIIPSMDLPEEEMVSYANDVLTRFANPYIEHHWSDIALNSVSKFKVRVLPSLLGYYEKFGKCPEGLARAFGSLIRFYKAGAPRDDAGIIEKMKALSVKEILQNEEWWGQDCSFLYEKVAPYAAEPQR